MPAVQQAVQITAGIPTLNARGADDEIVQVTDYIVPAGGLPLNSVIEMGGMGEGLIFTGMKLVAEDCDSGGTPALSLDCGIISGVYGDKATSRTCGNEFFAASTIGQTGGVQTENKAAGLLTPKSADITPYGLKVAAAPATVVVGAKLRLVARFKPAAYQS